MPRGVYVRTEEIRRRQSEAMTGRKLSDEHKMKVSKAMTGRHLSEEHKKNLSQSRKGKCTGPDHPNWRGGIYNNKKEYQRAYGQRPENKIKHNTRSRKYYQRFKKEVLSHYSPNGILECSNPFGEHKTPYTNLDALSIDHINGGGGRQGMSGYTIYRWLKKQEYPEGYQTLCMNCQCIKRMKNREVRKPWQI